jgi:hypothetical protein
MEELADLATLHAHRPRTCSVVRPFPTSNPSGIARQRKARCNPGMGTKSREVVWGSQVRGAKMTAEHARQRAREAAREADRAEAYAWSVRMEGFGGPAQPSPTIAQCAQRRLRLVRGQVPPLRNERQHSTRCRSPSARHADMET